MFSLAWNGDRAAVAKSFGIQACIKYFCRAQKQAVLHLVFSRRLVAPTMLYVCWHHVDYSS